MDRQTLRDWIHAFNERGPEGLINAKAPGAKPKLTAEQRTEFSRLVETGPDVEKDGVDAALKDKALAPGTPIEIWFQDEARIGQKNGRVYE